jgi:hypothetical protein
MMGLVSVFVSRYRLLLFPALALLAFVAFKIRSTPGSDSLEILSPFFIGTGLIIMYQASSGSWATTTTTTLDNGGAVDGGSLITTTTTINWLLYWLGETIVISIFTYNSVGSTSPTPFVVFGCTVFGLVTGLWFRGKFWNYIIVIGLELLMALFIAVSFPVFEMILEAILNEKLKKVGEKVRAHHDYMEKYYSSRTKQ